MSSLPQPQVTFFNGTELVAGAEFIYESAGIRIMVDCGLIQGTPDQEKINYEDFQYDPTTIDYLFVTHSHMDHVGRIPKLVKHGFRGKIYSTKPTRDIGYHMLYDELSLMMHALERPNTEHHEPLFMETHIEQAMSMWTGYDYHQKIQITDTLSVTLYDAGHILGSAMVLVDDAGTQTLFTGDLGNSPSILLADTEQTPRPHYLITESVYGDRNHIERDNRSERLKQVYLDNLQRRGVLVIPAFSVERTQELLLEFNNMIETGAVPRVPFFVDSPLGIKVTEVFQKYPEYMRDNVSHQMLYDNVFTFPGLTFTKSAEQSKAIEHVPAPKVILASSGMSAGGRVLFHERNYLSDANNTLLFVGYQAPGTLGRKIQEGVNPVYIMGSSVTVRARIEVITGYSGHKDADHLLEFAHGISERIKKVYCVLGEAGSSATLAQNLRDNFDLDAVVPERRKAYELTRVM